MLIFEDFSCEKFSLNLGLDLKSLDENFKSIVNAAIAVPASTAISANVNENYNLVPEINSRKFLTHCILVLA